MNVINSTNIYKTTSSCSGRIAVFAEKNAESGGCWLFVSHEPVNLHDQNPTSLFENKMDSVVYSKSSAMDKMFESMQPVYFKFEPFILHIAAPIKVRRCWL